MLKKIKDAFSVWQRLPTTTPVWTGIDGGSASLKNMSAARLLRNLDQEHRRSPERWPRIKTSVDRALAEAGIAKGVLLEIGGRANPRHLDFPNFDYVALDLVEKEGSPVPVAVGDITCCPQIPNNSYDFILSVDVFEHIDKPWLAGAEITRILKPGGVTFHSTLFSWRYHPCPIDYFRFSPEGLASLFPSLRCVVKEFDYAERRRNFLGRGGNSVEPDSIGGWRENVRVNYAGIKPE